jgi:hypothetical protein
MAVTERHVYDATVLDGDAVVAEFRGRSRSVPTMAHPPGFTG